MYEGKLCAEEVSLSYDAAESRPQGLQVDAQGGTSCLTVRNSFELPRIWSALRDG